MLLKKKDKNRNLINLMTDELINQFYLRKKLDDETKTVVNVIQVKSMFALYYPNWYPNMRECFHFLV